MKEHNRTLSAKQLSLFVNFTSAHWKGLATHCFQFRNATFIPGSVIVIFKQNKNPLLVNLVGSRADLDIHFRITQICAPKSVHRNPYNPNPYNPNLYTEICTPKFVQSQICTIQICTPKSVQAQIWRNYETKITSVGKNYTRFWYS